MLVPPPASTPRPPFALETLARLPLAEAFYTQWTHLATDDLLDDMNVADKHKIYPKVDSPRHRRPP